jgi:hypothetical protein
MLLIPSNPSADDGEGDDDVDEDPPKGNPENGDPVQPASARPAVNAITAQHRCVRRAERDRASRPSSRFCRIAGEPNRIVGDGSCRELPAIVM